MMIKEIQFYGVTLSKGVWADFHCLGHCHQLKNHSIVE